MASINSKIGKLIVDFLSFFFVVGMAGHVAFFAVFEPRKRIADKAVFKTEAHEIFKADVFNFRGGRQVKS